MDETKNHDAYDNDNDCTADEDEDEDMSFSSCGCFKFADADDNCLGEGLWVVGGGGAVSQARNREKHV